MTSRQEQNKFIANLTGNISDPKIAKRLSDALSLVHQHVLHGQDDATYDPSTRATVLATSRQMLRGHEYLVDELKSRHNRSPHHRF